MFCPASSSSASTYKDAECLTAHTYKLHQVSFSQQPVWLTSLTRSATCTYISTSAADLHSSLYLLPGFPFVPAVSHQLSRGGEKGAGKGGSFRVQVSLASSPLFSFLTVSLKHMACFNPKPQPLFVVSLGCSHTCHFCGFFSSSSFLLSVSNSVRSFSSTSLRLAYFIYFCCFFLFDVAVHMYMCYFYSPPFV